MCFMNNEYNHVGKILVLSIARELILKLFKGQSNVRTRDIRNIVEEEHRNRGGLDHTKATHPVTDALSSLKKMKKANNPKTGFWDIFDEEGETNDDKGCVSESEIIVLRFIQSKMKEHEKILSTLQELVDSVITSKLPDLIVAISGRIIAHRDGVDTFIEVIEEIGIEKVKEVGLMSVKSRELFLISDYEDRDGYRQRQVGKYYVGTGSNTREKKRQLNDIARHHKIEMVVMAPKILTH